MPTVGFSMLASEDGDICWMYRMAAIMGLLTKLGEAWSRDGSNLVFEEKIRSLNLQAASQALGPLTRGCLPDCESALAEQLE